MKESFVKKIICPNEFEKVCDDIFKLYLKSNIKYEHKFVDHSKDTMQKSFGHENVLNWLMHTWAYFNGTNWDSILMMDIRKSEKFNKKIMNEYFWYSSSNKNGILLYNEAIKYGKKNKCELIYMNVIEDSPLSSRIKTFYKNMGFVKDSEQYVKLI